MLAVAAWTVGWKVKSLLATAATAAEGLQQHQHIRMPFRGFHVCE
jgi:hypothetical protein